MRQRSSSNSLGESFTASPETVHTRAAASRVIAPQTIAPAPAPPRLMSASVFASRTAREKGFVT